MFSILMRSRANTAAFSTIINTNKIFTRNPTVLLSNALSTTTISQAASAAATKNLESLVQPRASGAPPTDKNYPSKVLALADEILKLTLLEISDLNEIIRNRLGIQNIAYAAPVAAAAAPAAAPTAGKKDEAAAEPQTTKSNFTVKLLKFDDSKKIALIKEIKALNPEMNLVQAKKFVESVPGVVRKDVSKDEAEKLKKALQAQGATIELE